MPSLIVQAAPTIRAMVVQHMEQDATLVAMLPGGLNAIGPKVGVDLSKLARPFVFVANVGTQRGPRTQLWEIQVHAKLGVGFVAVEAVLERIRFLFDQRRWERPTAEARRPTYSEWAGMGQETPHPTLGTAFIPCRIDLTTT